jgi:hypothetical protein
MAGKPIYQLPDDETLQQMLHERGCEAVAREFGMSGSALGYRARKRGLTTAKGSAPHGLAGNTHVIEVPKGSQLSPEKLLRRVGLDPEEWLVTNVKAREGTWGNPDAPNEQIRLEVSVRPVKATIKPPDLSDLPPIPKPRPRKVKGNEAKLAYVIGDHHAPRHDKTFHALFLQLLRDDQPDLIEVNGDAGDFPSVSRHRTEEAYNHHANECLAGMVAILRDYRDAAKDAQIRLKRGNHDSRLYYYSKDNAPEIEAIAPGGGFDPEGQPDPRPWHDLTRLLYTEYHHIEYVTEDWDQAETDINHRLSAVHGHSTTKNPGAKILSDFTGSTLQNHTHRLSLYYKTSHGPDGPEIRLAGECGCACEVNRAGLGYQKNPDWQNGAMQVRYWDDGDFTLAPVLYLPGRLLLPDGRRYTA